MKRSRWSPEAIKLCKKEIPQKDYDLFLEEVAEILYDFMTSQQNSKATESQLKGNGGKNENNQIDSKNRTLHSGVDRRASS